MPNVTFKALTLLVVPAVLALTAQTGAAAKPYHARARQTWSAMSLPYRMSFDSAAPGYTTGGGIRSNDPNVYRDGQSIPYYDINPHGG